MTAVARVGYFAFQVTFALVATIISVFVLNMVVDAIFMSFGHSRTEFTNGFMFAVALYISGKVLNIVFARD